MYVMNLRNILFYSAFTKLKNNMEEQRLAELRAAYTKPYGKKAVPWTKETREKPDVVVKYAFGEYGETWDTKDSFSASFWKPTR